MKIQYKSKVSLKNGKTEKANSEKKIVIRRLLKWLITTADWTMVAVVKFKGTLVGIAFFFSNS